MKLYQNLLTSLIITALSFMANFTLHAQFMYDEVMKEGKPLNFYEIQKKAEEYWATHDKKVKGNGYKAYKRWEYNWQNRVMDDGSFPPAGLVTENYNKYLQKYRHQNYTDAGFRNNISWSSIGPASAISGYTGSGRINSIAFHPTNHDIFYAGSAGGGFWMTTDGGTNWITTTDKIGRLGVSGIVVLPSDPKVIFIATGDGDAGDNKSVGVLKSTDGGYTWNKTGLDWSAANDRLIRKLIIDPTDENIMYVAASNGIYRTVDGAKTWKIVITGNYYDIEAKPQPGSNILYASTGGEIFRSSNNGQIWVKMQSIPGSNRIELAVTLADPTVVYAISSKSSTNGLNGIYKSTNSGSSFVLQSNSPNVLGYNSEGSEPGGQGWYDLILAADPADANTIYTGGVNCWKSTDGGLNWSLKSFWYQIPGVTNTHADKHSFAWRGNQLFEGNDGGLVFTADGGDSWTNVSGNMTIGQIYRIGISQKDDKILAGHQDNGTKLGDVNGVWTNKFTGGDGMECFVHPGNADILFTTSQNGHLNKSTNGGNNFYGITPVDYDGAWVTPFGVDPNEPNTIYAAYKEVYKSEDAGENWTAISEDLSGDNLTLFRVAPSNSDYIYTGTSGRLFRTTDGGTTWQELNTPGDRISMLTVNPADANTIYVVRQNYNAGQKVYKSTDGGDTWQNISSNLPNIPANAILCTDLAPDALFVGMDVGIFFWSEQISDWVLLSENLPNVRISEFEFDKEKMMLYVATYGRGIWKTPIPLADAVCNFTSNIASFSDCDNFNGYTIGGKLTTQAKPRFSVADNNPDNDAVLVNDAPLNASNCIKLNYHSKLKYNVGNSLQGRKILAPARLEWRMYIPEGKNGSWTLQTDSLNYPLDVEYNGNGEAIVKSNGVQVSSFSFNPNTWMNISIIFNPAESKAELWTDKQFVYKYASFTSGQITSLEFKGIASSPEDVFYADDLLYYEVKTEDCLTNGVTKFVCVNGKVYKNSNYALCDAYTAKEWTEGTCCTLTGITTSATDTKCGLDNGSATAQPIGGKGISYTWSNGSKTATATNLSPGIYYVTVSSIEGCKSNDSVLVNASQGIMASVDSISINGLAVVVNDGLPPFKYIWNTGDTTSAIMPDTSGTYTVTVTDANGCSVVLEYIYVKVATKDVKDIAVLIFPNPSTGIFNIKTDIILDRINVSDINGRILKSVELPANTIDLSELSSGVYYLMLQTGNSVTYRKLMLLR